MSVSLTGCKCPPSSFLCRNSAGRKKKKKHFSENIPLEQFALALRACTNRVNPLVTGPGAYQHIDGAAHSVLWTFIMSDGAIRQQILQEAAEQHSQLLS